MIFSPTCAGRWAESRAAQALARTIVDYWTAESLRTSASAEFGGPSG
ncbi:MAG: hypothetical protein QOF53_981 [Nocardioidaceae bacterium]|jgi:hypothetical protein|nr:hypothetical protein [Nocardioidaceae bacterium]